MRDDSTGLNKSRVFARHGAGSNPQEDICPGSLTIILLELVDGSVLVAIETLELIVGLHPRTKERKVISSLHQD